MSARPAKSSSQESPGVPPVSTGAESDDGSRLAFYRLSARAAAGELAAGVVHDINNPLQVMMLHLELLQTGRAMPNWIEMFAHQVQRISDLTNRLRDYAHAAAQEPPPERMDLNRCVDAALALAANEFQREGIAVQCSLAPDGAEILGNMAALRQALLELLINACEAMLGGGTVRIETRREGPRVALRVSDSGPGITEEVREGIFKPFVTTKGPGRVGIGLAICARNVGQLGGEISVEDGGVRGASFLIAFPALEKQGAPSGAR